MFKYDCKLNVKRRTRSNLSSTRKLHFPEVTYETSRGCYLGLEATNRKTIMIETDSSVLLVNLMSNELVKGLIPHSCIQGFNPTSLKNILEVIV
jgi:hypothetical protein